MRLRGILLKLFQVWLSALMRSLRLVCVLALGWAMSMAAAQTAGRSFFMGAAPAWVTPIAVEADVPVPMDQIRNGAYYLLADRQVRVSGPDRQSFHHFATKVVNDKGLEDAASIDIDYDPTYQRLTMHSLAVHRQGQVLSRLSQAQIRTLQRERELEAQVLDGQLTVSIAVKDVRVGDVVEYAYTLQGTRPVMKGHQSGTFDMQWRSPLYKVHARLLWPADRPLRVETSPGVPPVQERNVNGQREFVWTAQSLPGLQVDDQVPAWYDPYPFVQWTSFRDWGEVSRWAVPLYQVPALPAGELSDEVRRIRQEYPDRGDQVVAVLRFVQQNIRYLSVAIGEGSYTPSPPAVVMQRRFGDCKDKTLLTLTMLKALGIDAQAALVNTTVQEGVKHFLPSAGAFNHVLVRARVGAQWVWIDPTNDPQTGTLMSISQPYFGMALVVDPETRDLESMPHGVATQTQRKVRSEFDATLGVGKTATLTVTTELVGRSAEKMRSQLARSNRDELQRDYLNFYDHHYPGIEVAAPLSVNDNTRTNVLTVVEHYRIGKFWTPGSGPGNLEASVGSPDMHSQLRLPDERVRNAPLAVSHPLVFESTTVVQLPEDWNVDPEHHTTLHPAFRYSDNLTTTPRRLTRVSRYASLSDHVKPDDMADYVGKLEEARRYLWLELTYRPQTAAPTEEGSEPLESYGWPVAVYFLLLAAACYWLARKLYRYDPPDQAAAGQGAQPWGFWLVLFGFLLVFDWVKEWKTVWESVGPVIRDLWFHVVLHRPPESTRDGMVTFGATAMMLTLCVVQLLLYFGRRTSLPRVTYGILGLAYLLSLLSATLSDEPMFTGPEGPKNIRELLTALLWCLYLYRSRRVKATFVRRYRAGVDRTAPAAPAMPSRNEA